MDTLKWNEIGVLRSDPVFISGTNCRPKIPNTEELYKELQEIKINPDCVDRSMNLFIWSCRTQMFKDGNKRVSTLIANMELIKNNCGILSIPENKDTDFKMLLVKYYESNDSKELKQFLYNYCYFPNLEGLSFSNN